MRFFSCTDYRPLLTRGQSRGSRRTVSLDISIHLEAHMFTITADPGIMYGGTKPFAFLSTLSFRHDPALPSLSIPYVFLTPSSFHTTLRFKMAPFLF